MSIVSRSTEHLIEVAASSQANVLLTGPTGSGKTCLAREIHDRGSRSGRPFVSVNLASLHEGTLESELFGHERGAFTSADSKRVGRLELAQGGTVFLDEIGELTPRLQARLLEFLQSRTICPVGGNRDVRLDVRVIAATHRDLLSASQRAEFREDLFHRLRVISILLRPLRDRRDEFDEIVHRCLEEVCRAAGQTVLRLSEGLALRLENYSWPGNFRELRNVLEFAVLSASGPELCAGDLPEWFDEAARSSASAPGKGQGPRSLGTAQVPLSLDFHESLSNFEREYLRLALFRFRGRINKTSREIGLSKATLIRRLKAYGITPDGLFQAVPQDGALRQH